MMESEKYSCIKQLRKRTGLPVLQCQEIAAKAEYDLAEALYIADGCPKPPVLSEIERLQDLPNESKIETNDHVVSVTCPHCGEGFFELPGGAYAGAE